MRKADYLTLARALAVRITAPARLPIACDPEERARVTSEARQAVDLARYLADHLTIDGRAFLALCGLK